MSRKLVKVESLGKFRKIEESLEKIRDKKIRDRKIRNRKIRNIKIRNRRLNK